MYFWTEFTKPYMISFVVCGFIAGSVVCFRDPMFGMAVAWVMTPAMGCVLICVKLILHTIVRAKRFRYLARFAEEQKKATVSARF